jgi:hypothetical protein
MLATAAGMSHTEREGSETLAAGRAGTRLRPAPHPQRLSLAVVRGTTIGSSEPPRRTPERSRASEPSRRSLPPRSRTRSAA